MQKTNIEWTQQVWNPLKGLCPVDCKLPDGRSYCYARGIYNRFDWMLEDTGYKGYLAEWELEQPIKRKKPTKIFVCSTFELFHPCTKFARDAIFKTIESCPQHTFQILTKYPQNIDRPMPDNVYLGVSITEEKDMWRYIEIRKIPARILFISYEPLIGKIESNPPSADWIIIGRLTGHGNKYNPKKEWIQHIINRAKGWKEPQPIFLKNNLKPIMENLIQEFPHGKV